MCLFYTYVQTYLLLLNNIYADLLCVVSIHSYAIMYHVKLFDYFRILSHLSSMTKCSREKITRCIFPPFVRAKVLKRTLLVFYPARNAESKRLRDLARSRVSPRCILLASSARYAAYTWESPDGSRYRRNNSTNF